MSVPGPLRCFIASLVNSRIEPYLEERQFCHGLVIFGIPEYGILFRCRVEGDEIELEFAALFALLKFIKTRLAHLHVTSLEVISSNPEFVFSFRPNSKHLAPGSNREKLLKEYLASFRVDIRYEEARRNRAYLSPTDYPALPQGQEPMLKPGPADRSRGQFKPFQRGIRLQTRPD